MIEPWPIHPDDSDLKAALKRSLNERAREQAFRDRRRTLVGAWNWAHEGGFSGNVTVWAERSKDRS